jgi:hypothetical protein
MDPSNWKFGDIATVKCPHCGGDIEFWKDDVKRACDRCGQEVFNPSLKDTCLSWCDSAAECIGSSDISHWKRKRRECGNEKERG